MEEKLLKLTDSHFFQLYEITFILDIWLTKTPTIKLLDCLIVELITQIKIKILMIHVDFPSIVNSLMNGAYNFPSSLNFVSHTNYFLYFSFSLVWLCDRHVICDISSETEDSVTTVNGSPQILQRARAFPPMWWICKMTS